MLAFIDIQSGLYGNVLRDHLRSHWWHGCARHGPLVYPPPPILPHFFFTYTQPVVGSVCTVCASGRGLVLS